VVVVKNGKKISWVDKVSNEEMLAKVKEDRQIMKLSSGDDSIGLDIF